VLILDEPTAGVDVELRRQLWAYVVGLNKLGVTIVLTTHYLQEAEELCDASPSSTAARWWPASRPASSCAASTPARW